MIEKVIFIDGSCEPVNPNGNVGIGVVIYTATDFKFERSAEQKRQVRTSYTSIKKEHEISETFRFGSPGFEWTSNNMAEHIALTKALQFILENNDIKITIFSDSEMLVKQMKGEYAINPGKVYYEAAAENQTLLNTIKEKGGKVQFEWIPRDYNSRADHLSNKNHPEKGKYSK